MYLLLFLKSYLSTCTMYLLLLKIEMLFNLNNWLLFWEDTAGWSLGTNWGSPMIAELYSLEDPNPNRLIIIVISRLRHKGKGLYVHAIRLSPVLV